MAKLNKPVSLRPNETVMSIVIVKSHEPPYLLGNIQSAKSKKKFQIVEGVQAGRELPATTPTYLRNIQTGKSKKKSLSP